MRYYSTNGKAGLASLREAVVRGLAPDGGLYMPERIVRLPEDFFRELADMDFGEMAFAVASAMFGEDVAEADLRRAVDETLAFDCPLVKVEDGIYALELFHGPTLAFKDVGARFMARLLRLLTRDGSGAVNVLVATSGDTGSAVANGFLGVEGVHVYVLYPKGRVSHIQECQFTTLGGNVTAVAVDGSFDDCQRLVKQAFVDDDLKARMNLTSANSINVARFLPQAFYYFYAVAQMFRIKGYGNAPVICVPSGNFGNLCAALFAHEMGLPVRRFIAANNANDVFLNWLRTGCYEPMASRRTIANAMDVGNPSNFARILDLYGGSHGRITDLISGAAYADGEIRDAMRRCYEQTGYVLDPHGACGYQALKDLLLPGETGVFCETAHPAKFKETVDETLGIDLPIPERLRAFMRGEKRAVPLAADFGEFKEFLLK